MSEPFGKVNVISCIPKEEGTVTYHMVDTAVQLIQQVGPGAVSYKSGVEHAYKLIPIHMDDVPALGIKLFDDWLWDTTILMVVAKTEKGTCLVFLGVELDTIAMQA